MVEYWRSSTAVAISNGETPAVEYDTYFSVHLASGVEAADLNRALRNCAVESMLNCCGCTVIRVRVCDQVTAVVNSLDCVGFEAEALGSASTNALAVAVSFSGSHAHSCSFADVTVPLAIVSDSRRNIGEGNREDGQKRGEKGEVVTHDGGRGRSGC